MYNWGCLCRGQSIDPPVLDQSLIPTVSSRSKTDLKQAAFASGWKKLSAWSMIRLLPFLVPGRMIERIKAVHFSKNILARLKQDIVKKSGCRCSTNVALSAYLTSQLIRLFKLPGKTLCVHVTVIDIRKRLSNIPPEFAGNAAFSVLTPGIRADANTGEIAHAIHHSLSPVLTSGSAELHRLVSLAIDLVFRRIYFIPFDINKMHAKKPSTFYMNNFSKLPIYDVDFGTGKPVAVIPHNLPDPILIWPAPPSKGGVEVYFTGVIARTIHKLPAQNSWLEQLNQGSIE